MDLGRDSNLVTDSLQETSVAPTAALMSLATNRMLRGAEVPLHQSLC